MCAGVEMRSDEEGGVLSMEVGGITGTWGDWALKPGYEAR